MTARQRLLALPEAEARTLMDAYDEAQKRGVSVLGAVMDAPAASQTSPAIADVIAEIGKVKRTANRAESYVSRLEQIANAFAKGREALPIDQFTLADVERFMDAHTVNYRSTLRSKLSTLFKFAIRRGYRTDNPCERLETVSVPHVPPAVFTVAQTEKCLEYLKQHPQMLAWFVLSTFAGLRPEEAQKTSWKEINLDEGWIRVEAQTSKVRQRRVVYPLPTAIEWLRFAQRKKSKLPLTTKARTLGRNELRKLLGWKKWPLDVTRHTAASYWLAHSGSAATVATALGHSESVLRRHYMALVTKSESGKFWRFAP